MALAGRLLVVGSLLLGACCSCRHCRSVLSHGAEIGRIHDAVLASVESGSDPPLADDPRAEHIVVEVQDSWSPTGSEGWRRLHGELPSLRRDTHRNFQDHCAECTRWIFVPPPHLYLIVAAACAFDLLPQAADPGRREVRLGRLGISNDGSQAMIFVRTRRGLLVAISWVLLEHRDDGWSVVGKRDWWAYKELILMILLL